MTLALRASTEAGARLCALADVLSDDLATRAAAHDRAATFPHASSDALRDAGYFAAPIPKRLGGLGVQSLHDLVVASVRLADGDASVAIGVNMHLVAVRNMVRILQIAEHRGDERRAAALAQGLQTLTARGEILAAAISEPKQDLLRPSTVATSVEGGWRIDGRKIFCTMSPAATELYASVRYVDRQGIERYGYVFIPVDAPGLTVHDDWDAMGMRASGSNSVSLDGVVVPEAAVRGGFPTGDATGYMERNLAAGLFHASASLGVAEAAHEHALNGVKPNGHGPSVSTQGLVADSAIELSACRAALGRAAALIDRHQEANPTSHGTPEELLVLFSEAQAVKTFVNETAVRLVDRSLTLAGGRGYLNGHPIARAYRDVRASAFMNPLASGRAHEFLGQVALGMGASLG